MSSQPTLSERVYNAVLDKIVRREFPEAGRLPSEAALAEVFGVSRPIVREALARLKDDGIIASRKGSGSYVQSRTGGTKIELAPIGSIVQVLKLHEFRADLEAAAAAAAAENASSSACKTLKDALGRVQSETGQIQDDATADFAFHFAVAQASGNPYFEFVLRSIRDHLLFAMALGRQLGIRDPQRRVERRKEEHHAIFSAIASKDAEQARKLMRRHILGSRKRLLDGKA